MKKCAYCGWENEDKASTCRGCGTSEFEVAGVPPPVITTTPEEPKGSGYQIGPLSEAEMQNDLVTIIKCPTLQEADMVRSMLEGAGISAVLPDEFLMQSFPLTLTYGFVRVQISPKDYDAAKDILTATDQSG